MEENEKILNSTNDYILILNCDNTELIKINSMLKEDGICYAEGIKISVKEYAKRTVTEKYHFEVNSFRIKVDISEGQDIQKIGKDTYWSYRQALDRQELGRDEINNEMVSLRKEMGHNTENEQKLYNIQCEFHKFMDEKKEFVNQRYCYSETKYSKQIARLDSIEEVNELLESFGICIPTKLLEGLTNKIS